MANELQFYGSFSQTGLTVTARVYDDSGVQVGADVTCAEAGTDAIYIGDMPTAASAGSYGVRFISSGAIVGDGVIDWDGSNEVTQGAVLAAIPSPAEIEAALLNEGDGQQLIDAIAQAIGNTNTDEIALVAAVRADLERSGGAIDLIETRAEADTRQAALLAQHTATQAAISSSGGLTAAQASELNELWQIRGLDPANPVTITTTDETSGAIDIAVSGDGKTTSTLARQ